MNALGIKSELKLYDGATHGFFNLGKGDGSAYRQTITEMDEFLRSVGFIPASSAN
jgi:dienelactone hydrolase